MNSTSNEAKLATAKTVLSTAASVAATLMLARSVAHEIFPHEFRDFFLLNTRKFFTRFSSQLTVVIDEYDGFVSNKMYEASETYLGTRISPSTQRINVSKPEKENKFNVKMESNEEIIDVFQGVKFKWILAARQKESRNFNHGREFSFKSEVRSFEVSFPKKHKDMVLETYFPYIVKLAKSLKQEKKTLKIFTVDHENMYGNLSDAWRSMNLDHPATFDTLAMDNEVKDRILKDLDRFLKRRDYYKKVGKAWKRGYLLYGPPGTGKSSLIAAMANHLNFDIYDLELTELRANSDLRRLLVATANRSILVVEDIDCSIELQDRAEAREMQSYPKRRKQVTLSGLLNFIDGLWSSCGDERIIIFTTNHKEQLDPALLRPGRMDVHIHMSYCTSNGFQVLASNYLGIKDHALFGAIEELIKTTQVTPAEVAEQLMRSDGVDNALGELIEFVRIKNEENEESNGKKMENDRDEVAAETVMEEKFKNVVMELS